MTSRHGEVPQKDTYGITVYQEQVMLLSRLLANFTRGESDALRKAMGKKLRDKLDHMKPKFIAADKRTVTIRRYLKRYGATGRSLLLMRLTNRMLPVTHGWLIKQHTSRQITRREYMAAAMSRNISNITEITKLMDECKAMSIKVLGPDVNESNLKFTVNEVGTYVSDWELSRSWRRCGAMYC